MTQIEEELKPTYNVKGDKRKCIQDFKVCTDNKIKNTKFSNELTDNDQISIVSDAMFKTMLGSSERKKYPCKLLSGLLDNSFEELLENTEFYKNELDKTSIESKGERSDLILKMGDDYIVVEMNMRNEVGRNIEYSDRLYRRRVLVGKDYIYSKVLSVNLNNFYFEGCNKIMDVFYTQNDEGLLLDHKTSIQIYLPLLLKKCYNQGEKALSEFEKTILVMTSPDRTRASDLAKGDDILKEYINESKKVEKEDNFLREAYDHELSAMLAEREEGIEIGRKLGIEQGRLEERETTLKKIIKTLVNKEKSADEISELIDIPVEEIQSIIENLD